MHRSIMQNLERKVCYLCGKEGTVEAHHCLHGTASRRLAEQDGLIVNLCPECHRNLHDKGMSDDALKMTAERIWMNYNRADEWAFIARYGRGYI